MAINWLFIPPKKSKKLCINKNKSLILENKKKADRFRNPTLMFSGCITQKANIFGVLSIMSVSKRMQACTDIHAKETTLLS